jgi:hypothetical protein
MRRVDDGKLGATSPLYRLAMRRILLALLPQADQARGVYQSGRKVHYRTVDVHMCAIVTPLYYVLILQDSHLSILFRLLRLASS